MHHRLRRRWLPAILLALSLAALPALVGADHSWGSYHWARTSNPFTLSVGDNVSSTWDPYLNEAISDWDPSSVLELEKVIGGTRPKQCKPTSGQIEVCSERYGFNGWLGLAQIWVKGSHITQAVAKVNDSYFNTATYNKPEWRRLVMCQEIAHDFGLDHQDENFNNPNLGSCMDYTSNPKGPPSNEHPNAHDFDQLEAIYGHTDSTTTVGSSEPSGPGNGGGNNRADWGRLIRGSRESGVSLYVLETGPNTKVFTFVTWAR